MFIKYTELLTKNRPLSRPYLGVVVDNNDPLFLGRVKCKVDGLFEEVEDNSYLPWIYQWSSSGLGGRSDLSSFSVPDVGSELTIEFPYEDIYSGYYTGYWQTRITHQGTYDEDYPWTYGFRDGQGTQWKVNRKRKSLELNHTSGSFVRFDNNGDIEISSKNNIVFSSADGKTKQTYNMNTGRAEFKSKDETNFGGAKTNITSKVYQVSSGSENKKLTGGSIVDIGGGSSTKVGGARNTSIVGGDNTAVSGGKSSLVAGKTSETYGAGYSGIVALGGYNLDILLGNYSVAVKAGNIDISTLIGNVKIGNKLASVSCSLVGAVEIDAKLTATIKALVSAKVEATVSAEIKSALIKLGAGTAPILTTMTMPVVDTVSGAPSMGVATILAG